MKILLDENLSFKLKSKLRSVFPNLVHVSDIRLTGQEDESIFEYARNNNFDAIITNDEDYYWLSLLKGSPPKIIWLRTGNMTTNNLVTVLSAKQHEIEYFLLEPNEICLEIR
jgi:predicted nuclease of predicted toxin-antitoxin system